MNLFFQPFVDQAIRLQEKGVTWEWNGVQRTTYLHPLGLCVDTPARAAVLKISTFHGYNGCTYCHQRGKRINGVMKWVYTKPAAEKRTDAQIRKRMMKPNSDIKTNDGIWDVSVIAKLGIDLVNGIPIDILHAVLEGGVKLVTTNLTTASLAKKSQ